MGQVYVITVEVFDKSSTKVYISDVSVFFCIFLAPLVDDFLSGPSFWLGRGFFLLLPDFTFKVTTLWLSLNSSVLEKS